MKETDLKKLAKFVLKEIYAEPQKEHPLVQMFSSLANALQPKHPSFFQIPEAKKASANIIVKMVSAMSQVLSAASENNVQAYKMSGQAFSKERDFLMSFSAMWAQRIDYFTKQSARDEIDYPMTEIKRHLEEIAAQGKRVIDNLRMTNDVGTKNIINAKRETEHLQEIFKALKQSVDDLFAIGIKYGYVPSPQEQSPTKKK